MGTGGKREILIRGIKTFREAPDLDGTTVYTFMEEIG